MPRSKPLSDARQAKIAKAIKEDRERLGMTQTELARRVGVTQPNVSAWEEGRSRPSTAVFIELVKVLGLRSLLVDEVRVFDAGPWIFTIFRTGEMFCVEIETVDPDFDDYPF